MPEMECVQDDERYVTPLKLVCFLFFFQVSVSMPISVSHYVPFSFHWYSQSLGSNVQLHHSRTTGLANINSMGNAVFSRSNQAIENLLLDGPIHFNVSSNTEVIAE